MAKRISPDQSKARRILVPHANDHIVNGTNVIHRASMPSGNKPTDLSSPSPLIGTGYVQVISTNGKRYDKSRRPRLTAKPTMP